VIHMALNRTILTLIFLNPMKFSADARLFVPHVVVSSKKAGSVPVQQHSKRVHKYGSVVVDV